jgi:hypothetical protein
MITEIGSRSIIASSGISRAWAGLLDSRAAATKLCLGRVAGAQDGEILLELGAAAAAAIRSACADRQFLAERVRSPRICISSSLRKERRRMLRMASGLAVVQAEFGHHHGLGLVFLPDDLESRDRD